MNELESKWLGDRLSKIPDEQLFPLLNVGSSTLEFRTLTQPYIHANIFAPLDSRPGAVVYHTDIKPAPGVDLVGDLLDPSFQQQLAKLRPRSILLSNVLEHVTHPQPLCHALLGIILEGGLVFVSGPYAYPWHPDPIDTMFRPTIDDVAALFPGTTLLNSAILDSGNWRQWNKAERGRTLGRTLVRMLVPFYRPRKWLELIRQSPYLFKHIKAFAVVLRKGT